jgi:hypothetical protein
MIKVVMMHVHSVVVVVVVVVVEKLSSPTPSFV